MDQRSHERIGVHIPVKYYQSGILHSQEAEIIDLTPKGLRLLCGVPIREGAEISLEIEITMPSQSPEDSLIWGPSRPQHALVKGKVVRLGQNKEGYEVGVMLDYDPIHNGTSLLKEYLRFRYPNKY